MLNKLFYNKPNLIANKKMVYNNQWVQCIKKNTLPFITKYLCHFQTSQNNSVTKDTSLSFRFQKQNNFLKKQSNRKQIARSLSKPLYTLERKVHIVEIFAGCQPRRAAVRGIADQNRSDSLFLNSTSLVYTNEGFLQHLFTTYKGHSVAFQSY